jgi:hypothetical protein
MKSSVTKIVIHWDDYHSEIPPRSLVRGKLWPLKDNYIHYENSVR